MQFSSIDFVSNNFIHNNLEIKFHNHIDRKNIELINYYSKKFIEIIKKIDLIEFEKINDYTRNLSNTDILESNGSIEITIQIMKKYGFSERFIIKKMLGGENMKNIEYFSKKENDIDVKSAYLMDKKSRLLIKVPLKRKQKNQVRLIILIIKYKTQKVTYPLYLDIHHFAYSSNNYVQVPEKRIIFEEEFFKKIHSLF